MSRVTGKSISRLEHIRQSVEDILTTSNFERIYRNEYGGSLKRLIDEPTNEHIKNLARIIITRSIAKFENRIVVNSVEIEVLDSGDGFNIKIYMIDRLLLVCV
jgi:phage baseplate assembly protein W